MTERYVLKVIQFITEQLRSFLSQLCFSSQTQASFNSHTILEIPHFKIKALSPWLAAASQYPFL